MKAPMRQNFIQPQHGERCFFKRCNNHFMMLIDYKWLWTITLSLPTSQENHAQPESIATSCRPREGGTTCIKLVGNDKAITPHRGYSISYRWAKA